MTSEKAKPDCWGFSQDQQEHLSRHSLALLFWLRLGSCMMVTDTKAKGYVTYDLVRCSSHSNTSRKGLFLAHNKAVIILHCLKDCVCVRECVCVCVRAHLHPHYLCYWKSRHRLDCLLCMRFIIIWGKRNSVFLSNTQVVARFGFLCYPG